MTDDLDPRLAEAFAAWRAESTAQPDPAVLETARQAMRAAIVEPPAAGGWTWTAWRDRLARAVEDARSHPRLLAAAAAPLAVVALTAAGWSSPAGSPLHFVEVSREHTELALPGADRAGLELSFAERRLHDAAEGQAAAASLDEADSLLKDAQRDLPANPPAELAGRLHADVDRVSSARATLPTLPAPGATPSGCPNALTSPSASSGHPSPATPCAALPSQSATSTGGTTGTTSSASP